MRVGVAILFIAIASSNGDAAETKSGNINDLISCAKTLGLSKCITAYGIWRAERALQSVKEQFTWRQLANASDDELYSKLCNDTVKLLQHRPLIMDISDRYALQLKSSGNDVLSFDVISNADVSTARTSMKKMTKLFYQAIPFMILPGLVMSAVLPFFLPTIKMATLATGMLNNMALSGAIFTLLRNNAFNDKNYHPKRVIYVNAGYSDKYNPLAEGTSDDIVSTHYDHQQNVDVTHDVKDYHLIGMDPNTGISYPFDADWLKNVNNDDTKIKNVQILGEDTKDNDWIKPNIPVKWRKYSNR